MIVYDPLPLPDGSLSDGTVASHNCDSGHILVGSSTRTCTGDGNSVTGYFGEEEPFCQGLSTGIFKSILSDHIQFSLIFTLRWNQIVSTCNHDRLFCFFILNALV